MKTNIFSRPFLGLLGSVIFGSTALSLPSAAQVNSPSRITWITTAEKLTKIGATHTFICPPSGGNAFSSIWGTEIYEFTSPICGAAVHAGKINAKAGGKITIQILPGQNSYLGSTRNGVRSIGASFSSKSFRILGGVPIVEDSSLLKRTAIEIGPIPWYETAWDIAKYETNHLKVYSFTCSSAGQRYNVYGTDVYTADSSICTAAVHAGIISVSGGGKVFVRMLAGEYGYRGTTRYQVQSQDALAYAASFMFIR